MAIRFPASGAQSRAPLPFIAGPENRLAVRAAEDFFADRDCPYNPLVLYGPPGVGKSHLVQGLFESWKQTHPRDVVQCTSGGDFASEYAHSLQHGTYSAWSSRYRRASLLLLEDIGQLSSKHSAQGELTQIVDALSQTGGRLMMTSCVVPWRLPSFVAGLVSRLSAGLCVPIARPGPEARLAIVRTLAAQRGMELGADAARTIADAEATVPEISGVLHQLRAEVPAGDRIDAQHVSRCTQAKSAGRCPTLGDIAAHTARHFAIKASDLRSPSRRQTVVHARDVAMYLARQLTGGSLQRIGAYFGGRDHTTVSHGCQKAEEFERTDSQTRHALEQLREALGSPVAQ